MDTFFAVTAPGLEVFTARELRQLDLLPADATGIEAGGVAFKGDLAALYRANLNLRTANRVIVRLGSAFYARDFAELRQRASRLPWERFLAPGQPVAIRATCHKSKLYHSDAVAERVAGAIADRLGKESPVQKSGDEDADSPAQLVIVRLADDLCTVSIDSSGELLHRRGYRQAVAKAPLRETLAAALLMASGWDKQSPLVDPFCGSGTIAIEAALMARNIAPGIKRQFQFMGWGNFDALLWKSIVDEIKPALNKPVIFASDRDAGAIKMAQANAERAGVADAIQFVCQAVSNFEGVRSLQTSHSAKSGDFALRGGGWIVTNPPYGIRVSEGKDLRNLYARFGDILRAQCPGWQAGILCSDSALLHQTRLKLDTSLVLVNGGVKVYFGMGKV